MTTEALKSIVIDRISKINDKSFLETINAILETNAESIFYQSTPPAKATNRKGKAQINKDACFLSEQVVKEIDQWLSKK